MNVRNDLQPTQILGRDIQSSSAVKMGRSADAASVSITPDEAHLSSAASLASRLASMPDVRTEKVQALQMSIVNGYSIGSSDVAHSVMNFMLNGGE